MKFLLYDGSYIITKKHNRKSDIDVLVSEDTNDIIKSKLDKLKSTFTKRLDINVHQFGNKLLDVYLENIIKYNPHIIIYLEDELNPTQINKEVASKIFDEILVSYSNYNIPSELRFLFKMKTGNNRTLDRNKLIRKIFSECLILKKILGSDRYYLYDHVTENFMISFIEEFYHWLH